MNFEVQLQKYGQEIYFKLELMEVTLKFIGGRIRDIIELCLW